MPVPEQTRIPAATVVVSVYDGADTLARCIESLLAQDLEPEAIVVVDDGSGDAVGEVLDRYRVHPLVTVVVLACNRGVPAARNVGVACARSEVVVFIDADAYAPRGWLTQLLPAFVDPAVACVGGPDRAPEGSGAFPLAVDYSLRSWIATGRLRLTNPFVPYAPAGCNMAVRRRDFVAAGGFDERLDRRGEDKELVQRLRRAGRRVVYRDRAMVWHHRRATAARFWRQSFLSGRARVDILRLAPDAFAWAHLAPAGIVLGLLSSALCPGITAFGMGCAAAWAAYLLLLAGDGLTAAIQTRRWCLLALVPVTTSCIHWGYGLGLLRGLWSWMLGHAPGSGAPAVDRPSTRGSGDA